MADRAHRSHSVGPTFWRRSTGPPPFAPDWVVAVGGGTGAGTEADPWSLAHALSGAGGAIQPGDTIGIHGGTYTQTAAWSVTVNGTAGVDDDDPDTKVKFRNFPGEFVSITATDALPNAVLTLDCSYVWFWSTFEDGGGIEVWTNEDEDRSGFGNRASCVWYRNNPPQNGNKMIHVVARDGANGIFTGNGAGSDHRHHIELYGFISMNNGEDTSPRTHNMYVRHNSEGGTKTMRLTGCVLCNSVGHGIQIYPGSLTESVDDIQVDKMIGWGAGALGTATGGWTNYIISGGGASSPVRRSWCRDSVFYHVGSGSNEKQCLIGSTAGGVVSEDDFFERNYVVGGGATPLIEIQDHLVDGNPSLTFDDNEIIVHTDAGEVTRFDQSGSLVNFSSVANNAWKGRTPTATAWDHGGTNKTFATCMTDIGWDAAGNTAVAALPTVNKAIVHVLTKYNPYAHVAIFNWEGGANVAVDLSSFLGNGDEYEVHHFYDYVPGSGFGTPLLSGTYAGGTVNFPTAAHTPPAPVGTTPRLAPDNDTLFNAFLVVKR